MRKSIATALMLAATFVAHPASAQRTEVGNAATVVGDVKMSNATITRPRKIERRQRLAWGDRIDTGRRSQLQILLLDRSTFGVGANSQVRIDRFVYDPNEGRSVVATFFKGALRFFSGRQEGNNSADVETPSGRIGIRGTALDLLVGEAAKSIAEEEDFVDDANGPDGRKNEATLVVLRGPGAGTAGGLTVGRAEVVAAGVTVVLDRPGLAAYIPRNGAPPIGPFFMSNAGLGKMQDQQAPEVTLAANSGGGLLGDLLPVVGAVAGAAALGAILTGGGDNDGGRTNTTPPNPNNPNRTTNNNPAGKPPGR